MPEYPRAALRTEAVGRTTVAYKISPDGKVLDGEVVKSAGTSPAHKLLDFASFIALMYCSFEPATWRAQPIEAWAEVEYLWRIE